MKTLVETGFLLALNPKDRNHGWALSLPDAVAKEKMKLYISPAPPVELLIILKSRGLSDHEVALAL